VAETTLNGASDASSYAQCRSSGGRDVKLTRSDMPKRVSILELGEVEREAAARIACAGCLCFLLRCPHRIALRAPFLWGGRGT